MFSFAHSYRVFEFAPFDVAFQARAPLYSLISVFVPSLELRYDRVVRAHDLEGPDGGDRQREPDCRSFIR